MYVPQAVAFVKVCAMQYMHICISFAWTAADCACVVE